MNCLRDQFLSRSAFTFNQHGRRIPGGNLNLRIDIADCLRGADHSVEFGQLVIFEVGCVMHL